MKLNLPVSSYELRSRPASPARLVNCYPELMPPGGRSPVLLRRSPGISAWTTVGSGPIAGMYAAHIELTTGHERLLYVVSGSELYKVNSSGTATLLGDIGTPNRIDMASNLDTLVVVNEPNAYYWDGTTFGQITDEDFVSRGAGDVEFLNNYMLFREPNSARFFGSALGDATDFDALDFGIANTNTDDLVGMIADHQSLILFGSDSIETWENTTISGFPFERNINGTIEVGCLNAKTVARVFNLVHWVADDYTVRRLDGITPTKVSTPAIEQKLASETVLEAFTYEQEGHFFYCLSTNLGTYCLDVHSGEWAERESYGHNNWLPRHHAQFAGYELVGDSNSNKIGYLSHSVYQEWSATQRMEWTYQPVFADGIRAFHDRFEVVLETGVGLTTGQGSNPKIMLRYSDDGGVSWKSAPDREFGKRGETLSRAVWHNLGSSRQRVYRCAVSDPVPVTVTDTLLEVRGGRL